MVHKLLLRKKPSHPGSATRTAAPIVIDDHPDPFPRALFDRKFYLDTYPDVGASGLGPFAHFLQRGRLEGRFPSPGARLISAAAQRRSSISATPWHDIVALFPSEKRKTLRRPLAWKRLRSTVHPLFYSAQVGGEAHLTLDEAFDHFLSEGAFEGLRVSSLFNSDWYLRQLERTGNRLPVAPAQAFFHWLSVGWEQEIVPTPLFDERYYRDRHRDLENLEAWPFLHFLNHGCFEPGRRPSPWVAAARGPGRNLKVEQNPVLLTELMTEESGAPVMDLRRSSPLEDRAIVMASKAERLRSPAMQRLVDAAAAIEPLVLRPYGAGEVTWPPVSHGVMKLVRQAESMRKDLPAGHFDTIVLSPHCRMAGSARVTGALTRALAEIEPDKRVLLLTTELSDFERPDWFPDDLAVFDISSYAQILGPEQRIRLLLDLVRGVRPTRVVNVNSRLGWDLFKLFGRQLSEETDLSAYLFTWDLDARGNRGGYPITYFQECFGFLSHVVTDNSTLRDELIDRYALSTTLQERLVVAYTPVSAPVGVDHSQVFARRRREGERMRAFWAGRFDRQKRFDLVVELANRMPDLEILAWGKPVIGGSDVDFDNLPPNIKLQGTFEKFDDIPIEDCDFYLYTSEWDGVPTILIDAGLRGVATVASDVGGVPEVLNCTTGFPVAPPLEVNSYVDAINSMVENPDEVGRRARAFMDHTVALCSEQRYVESLSTAFAPRTEPTPIRANGTLEHVVGSLVKNGVA